MDLSMHLGLFGGMPRQYWKIIVISIDNAMHVSTAQQKRRKK
jgi:hypothetical protein